jgi:hypothetical protein
MGVVPRSVRRSAWLKATQFTALIASASSQKRRQDSSDLRTPHHQPAGGGTCHTTFAGLPDTTVSSGTSNFTTDPMATTAPRPIVTPFMMMEWLAIQA